MAWVAAFGLVERVRHHLRGGADQLSNTSTKAWSHPSLQRGGCGRGPWSGHTRSVERGPGGTLAATRVSRS